jgi:glycosyltransferase involved in cell wall biosynthesis
LDMAQAVTQVVFDTKLQKSLADNGKRFVSAKYDWKSISQTLNKIYEEVGQSQPF